MTLEGIEDRLAPHRLTILGAFHPDPGEEPRGAGTLALVGPAEPGFWAHVTAQPEWADGRPDPLDRWSRRVVGRIACDLGGKALFPFTGPPWHPFQSWALRTGRCWESPVRLLVHDRQGLMVSFRAALALPPRLDLPPTGPRPCETCVGQPCRDACPPAALTTAGYDVPACRAFLDTAAGADCAGAGCRVRRACPLSARYGRLPEQSAYHMSTFRR